MNAYETYQQYLGLKLYFEGNFDYFKYNGKTSASLTSFDKRKDKFKFIRKGSNKILFGKKLLSSRRISSEIFRKEMICLWLIQIG